MTVSPALTVSPLKMMQVSVVPEVLLQSPPTCGWPLSELSVTIPPLVRFDRPVIGGYVIVTVPLWAPDMPVVAVNVVL